MVVGIRYVRRVMVLLRTLSVWSQHSNPRTIELVTVRVSHDSFHALLVWDESSRPKDDIDTNSDEETKNIKEIEKVLLPGDGSTVTLTQFGDTVS